MKPETLGDLKYQHLKKTKEKQYQEDNTYWDSSPQKHEIKEAGEKSVKRQKSIDKNRKKRIAKTRTKEIMKDGSRARGKEKTLNRDAGAMDVYGGMTGSDYMEKGLLDNLMKRGKTN